MELFRINNDLEWKKSGITRNEFVDFLFEHLGQFGDPKSAINKCIDFAFGLNGGLGGFCIVAKDEGEVVGGLIMNSTGMGEYIPSNILVYVAVDSSKRGKGYGRKICEYAMNEVDGDVALHVEYENPAKRLYERIGFTSKYAEMRFKK